MRYAQQRHITVIPEIDLPGHTRALLAAYPEMGCTQGPYEVGHNWGIYEDVLCLGNEKDLSFLTRHHRRTYSYLPSSLLPHWWRRGSNNTLAKL